MEASVLEIGEEFKGDFAEMKRLGD